MQIVRRKGISPFTTMNLWLIPTFAYVIQKVGGIIRPEREWIWWVGLPVVFSLWFLINFKFSKEKQPIFKIRVVETPILTIKTDKGFFYRLWFLIISPIIWLIKGEVKIK